MSALSRRTLIIAAAGLGAARASAAFGMEAGRNAGADPFALGVASGDPAQDSFVLWTRLVGAGGGRLDAPAVPVGYEIAEDEGFSRIVRRGRTAASPRLAHAVHVEAAGLRPGRPYFYRFHALGVVSPAGRAVTAPLRASALRLAVVSCQHFEQGWFSAYRDIVAAQPDLILQLGDYIYETSSTTLRVRSFDGPEPADLEGYRRRHALYKSDPDLRAAHAATSWIATWDDHEVQNDYAGLANLTALEPEVFARRRAAAYQAYFEHMPVRPSLWTARGGPRMHRAVAWGDLATLPVLDGRQYRSAQACNRARQSGNRPQAACPELDDPGRTMLGAAQETWLSRALAAESRPWTVIAQQTVVAPLNIADGVMSDQWDGYRAARGRLLGGLTGPGVRNAVVLSGDIHSFWVNDIKQPSGDGPALATEIVTTCLAAANAPKARYEGVGERNPHVRFTEMDQSGYALIDVAPSVMRVDLRAVDDLADPASRTRSLARFAVEDRRPGAQPA